MSMKDELANVRAPNLIQIGLKPFLHSLGIAKPLEGARVFR